MLFKVFFTFFVLPLLQPKEKKNDRDRLFFGQRNLANHALQRNTYMNKTCSPYSFKHRYNGSLSRKRFSMIGQVKSPTLIVDGVL